MFCQHLLRFWQIKGHFSVQEIFLQFYLLQVMQSYQKHIYGLSTPRIYRWLISLFSFSFYACFLLLLFFGSSSFSLFFAIPRLFRVYQAGAVLLFMTGKRVPAYCKQPPFLSKYSQLQYAEKKIFGSFFTFFFTKKIQPILLAVFCIVLPSDKAVNVVV